MTALALTHDSWTHHPLGARGTLHLRGTVLDGDRVLDVASLAERLAATDGLEALARALDRLDGFFALVIERPGALLAAVDRVRSLPLFFGPRDGAWTLTDDPYRLTGESPPPSSFDPRAVDEFLITSYVTGRRTLHPAVAQLQAGEAVSLVDGECSGRFVRYYRYGYLPGAAGESPERLERELDALSVAAVERLLRVAGGRRIAIPLSGGRDSRLLALILKRLGRTRDVVTFTYGKPGNAEARVSEAVAAALGLAWHFVPYDESSWRRWFESEAMGRFYRMADGLSSVPHVMDWPAVGVLGERGVLRPGEVIVVPGHSADLPAGSRSLYVPDIYAPGCRDVEALVAAVINYHYCLYDWSARRGELLPGYRAHVLDVLEGLGGMDALDAAARAFESWDWQERQARLIVNSVRVYEFWGHEWWMPWWDREFVDFFARLPIRHKQGKRFYDRYVDRLAAEAGLRLPRAATVLGAALGQRARQVVRRNPETFRAARWLVRSVRRRRWQRLYDAHPMGWYGFVPPAVFEASFTGRESILAFMALDRVGRIRLAAR